MLLTNSSLSNDSGKGISSPLYGLKTERKSPLMVLLHELILLSSIFLPVFLERNFSKNIMVEVMSQTSEFTQPPLLQGEATTNGTRNPKPTGPCRDRSGANPAATSSSNITYSPSELSPADILPSVSL